MLPAIAHRTSGTSHTSQPAHSLKSPQQDLQQAPPSHHDRVSISHEEEEPTCGSRGGVGSGNIGTGSESGHDKVHHIISNWYTPPAGDPFPGVHAKPGTPQSTQV
ncbi:MAG TPA: hypothetical protein VGO93_06445 [Candidatus Xenobia bacterium]|jgi:hypothetical protein